MDLPINQIIEGDCLEVMRSWPDGCVQCVVTSPPYWGLRDYGIEPSVWGGDPACEHEWVEHIQPAADGTRTADGNAALRAGHQGDKSATLKPKRSDFCGNCGAWRGCYGLEPTPELFVEHTVTIFREVRRVLRDDGTLWLNLGDSYNAAGRDTHGTRIGAKQGTNRASANGSDAVRSTASSLKPKDLVGIPWRVALALQQPYYTGRIRDERDRVWLAAMLDAEGSVCGTEYLNGDRTKTNIYISITNTSVPIIEKCERLFPQDVKHVYEKTNGVSNRQCFRWDVERMETKALFLREVYPYLVAKRKQAIIGYTFIEMQRGLLSKKKGYIPEQQEKRSCLMSILSKLNGGEDVDLPGWVVEPPSLFEPGFYLRQDIIWHKPNPMPESVSDRCTKAHEYIFLLTKSSRYFFDAEAIREEPSGISGGLCFGGKNKGKDLRKKGIRIAGRDFSQEDRDRYMTAGANKRSVWTVPTAPFKEAHFATFPPELIRPCIRAGTSQHGCCLRCGAPSVRVTKRVDTGHTQKMPDGFATYTGDHGTIHKDGREPGKQGNPIMESQTLGWKPGCKCEGVNGELVPVPCVILDPFGGSGTTGMVAAQEGRDYVMIERNPKYVEMARAVRLAAVETAVPVSERRAGQRGLFESVGT